MPKKFTAQQAKDDLFGMLKANREDNWQKQDDLMWDVVTYLNKQIEMEEIVESLCDDAIECLTLDELRDVVGG